MPSCLVNRCKSSSGRKGQSRGIKMHKFPNDPQRIRIWLKQTEQNFANLEELVETIQEGQKRNRYFLCSLHFLRESYLQTPNGPVLRPDAIPVFPAIEEGQSIIEESLKKKRHRANKTTTTTTIMPPSSIASVEVELSASSSDNLTQDTDNTPDSYVFEPKFRTIATQTQYNLTNSKVDFLDPKEEPGDYLITPEAPPFRQMGPCVSTIIKKEENEL